MKKIIGLLVLAMLSLAASAQFPGQGPGNGKGGPAMNMGHIFGKVVDSIGKPIPDASVIVMQKKFDSSSKKFKEILVKGSSTKSNGEFDLEELPVFGELKLKISASGYSMLEQSISFMSKPGAGNAPGPGAMPSFDKDLGKVKMNVDVKQMGVVTVVASKPLVRLDADKKVFNVEKNIVSAGGTALDVMKNVPSVNVDIDGNVSVRNAAPQIYVDGRPTTLTLDQIPADAIESVEVITNPSAKYDAAGGSGGILNIVLKKNRKTGYNGNVRAGVDRRGAMNAGGDFNLRQGKFNLNASLMASQNKGVSTGNTNRTNLLDTPQTHIYQSNYNKTMGGFIFGKLGIDYLATNKTTLSLSAIRVHGEFKPYENIDINTDSLYNTGKISSYSNRISNSERIFNGGGLVFGMKHTFKPGEDWTVDANFFGGKNSNSALYTTNYYSNVTGDLYDTEKQKVQGSGSDRNFVIQTDYTKPLGTKTKLEAGLRAALRSRKNLQDNYIFDPGTGEYVLVTAATSNYTNQDNVYAAYAIVSSSIKNFSYKLGLRAESSNYNGELLSTKDQFKNSYPISLFPSVYLTEKLSETQTITLSYSRRVNRPNFFQLIPYTDYTDKLNITRGNPNLVPEFTQALELSYLKTFPHNNTLLGSIYYRHTDDLITRFIDEEENPLNGEPVLINTYINANSSYSAGAEVTSTNYLNKWWDISTNLNIYNSKINTTNVTELSQPAMWSWFAKFNSNFKLPSKFTAQLSATYQSKTNLAVSQGGGMMGPPGFGQAQSSSQGYIAAFWGVDLALKKTFLKNDAASVTLSFSDIFRSRINTQHSESIYFVQDYSRIRDPQMVRLNFAYRFGKMDVSLFKRKSQGTGESVQQ